MSRSFDEKLSLYARLAVQAGVNVQTDQELLVFADVADLPFVRLIVQEAYAAGAKHVQVMFGDDENTKTRFKAGSDAAMQYVPTWLYDGIEKATRNNAARLAVFGSDPSLLKDIDPARVAGYSQLQAKATAEVSKLIGGFAINWSIVGTASPAWAKAVFPNDTTEVGVQKLWDAIFSASRIDASDPVSAWTKHQDSLAARAKWLTELKLESIHFTGPGTDLKVGMAEATRWIGGWGNATNGVKCSPNVPTEEVFTVPHRERVDGFVSSTKPLSLRGQVIDGIRIEFSGGEAVKASAKAGEEILLKLLQTDDGARRLGEVALVPAGSPISKSGVLFFNTLYDENAACHIALGRAIDACFTNNASLSEEERRALGGNESIVHVDWMIGSEHIDLDGKRADGSSIPLLRKGEWAQSI